MGKAWVRTEKCNKFPHPSILFLYSLPTVFVCVMVENMFFISQKRSDLNAESLINII